MRCNVCDGSGYEKSSKEQCLNPERVCKDCIIIDNIRYYNVNYKTCSSCYGSGEISIKI